MNNSIPGVGEEEALPEGFSIPNFSAGGVDIAAILTTIAAENDAQRTTSAGQASRFLAPSKRPATSGASITFESLQPYLHLTIQEAAKQLGVGLTILKRRCRELNIPRWPGRKVQSLNRLLNGILDMTQGDQAKVQPALDKLATEKSEVLLMPAKELSQDIRRLRQAYFKEAHKRKRGKSCGIDADYGDNEIAGIDAIDGLENDQYFAMAGSEAAEAEVALEEAEIAEAEITEATIMEAEAEIAE